MSKRTNTEDAVSDAKRRIDEAADRITIETKQKCNLVVKTLKIDGRKRAVVVSGRHRSDDYRLLWQAGHTLVAHAGPVRDMLDRVYPDGLPVDMVEFSVMDQYGHVILGALYDRFGHVLRRAYNKKRRYDIAMFDAFIVGRVIYWDNGTKEDWRSDDHTELYEERRGATVVIRGTFADETHPVDWSWADGRRMELREKACFYNADGTKEIEYDDIISFYISPSNAICPNFEASRPREHMLWRGNVAREHYEKIYYLDYDDAFLNAPVFQHVRPESLGYFGTYHMS